MDHSEYRVENLRMAQESCRRQTPILAGGVLTFEAKGADSATLAETVATWLKDHPETVARATIPVMTKGEITELRLIL